MEPNRISAGAGSPQRAGLTPVIESEGFLAHCLPNLQNSKLVTLLANELLSHSVHFRISQKQSTNTVRTKSAFVCQPCSETEDTIDNILDEL